MPVQQHGAPITRWQRGLVFRLLGAFMGLCVGGALIVAIQVVGATAPARLTLHLGALRTVPKSFPALAFARIGSSAVAVPSLGIERNSPHQVAAPIASLTKLMTATVLLHDLPLSRGQSGPCLYVTKQDVTSFLTEQAANQSVVKVVAGTQLCEIDLLNGLFVHSANNYAELLVQLDQRTPDSFVAAMNAKALQLHMYATHYRDVSGIDPRDVSTAADLMRLVEPLMRLALVRAIVRQTSVVLPDAGVVSTYTPLLGHLGVIGVKSGRTDLAGGCDVMALRVWRDGIGFDTYAIVLGQRGNNLLRAAGRAAYALAHSAVRSVVVNHWRNGQRIGTVGWNGSTSPVVLSGVQRALWWQRLPTPRIALLSLNARCSARPLSGSVFSLTEHVITLSRNSFSISVASLGCVWRNQPLVAISFGNRLKAQATALLLRDVRRGPWWKGLL